MPSPLADRRCRPCEGGVEPLTPEQVREHLAMVGSHWKAADDNRSIAAEFNFRNYYHTTAFINAVVYLAHREDHHPDISFGYKTCTITWSTHAIDGLSENDFICAAKVDALSADD